MNNDLDEEIDAVFADAAARTATELEELKAAGKTDAAHQLQSEDVENWHLQSVQVGTLVTGAFLSGGWRRVMAELSTLYYGGVDRQEFLDDYKKVQETDGHLEAADQFLTGELRGAITANPYHVAGSRLMLQVVYGLLSIMSELAETLRRHGEDQPWLGVVNMQRIHRPGVTLVGTDPPGKPGEWYPYRHVHGEKCLTPEDGGSE